MGKSRASMGVVFFGVDGLCAQELLGHKDVKMMMIYRHVLSRGGLGVRSPIGN